MPYTIDTLRFFERLKKTEIPENAAREIAEMFKEASDSISEEIATRKDVELIVEKVVQKAKADIIKWVAGMLVAQAIVVATLVKLL